jgi:hypothetical protein
MVITRLPKKFVSTSLRNQNTIMSDSVFRTAQPAQTTPATPTQKADTTSTSKTADVPVPYLDYKSEHHKPFTVEYFELGNMWDDKDGGFTSEIDIIEDYMYHLIGDGQISNSTEAVGEKIKSMEKQAGIKKFDTISNRIAKITAFTKFLQETEDL